MFENRWEESFVVGCVIKHCFSTLMYSVHVYVEITCT